VAPGASNTTAPNAGRFPAKTLRHMVAKPKVALVGTPADVARLLGRAKNAR
jgi:hypothetical protein